MSEVIFEDYPLEAEKYRELIEAALLEWTNGVQASFRLLVGAILVRSS